tara:strand:- start:830 stop:1126 length:297 start_codon:yes stop_codon:yes gene_type:complete
VKKPEIVDAILALDSDAKVQVVEEKDIIWIDKNPNNITRDQINSKLAQLMTTYNSLKYQRERAMEYPTIVDQLDELYHNGLDGWKAKIKLIKDKYKKS